MDDPLAEIECEIRKEGRGLNLDVALAYLAIFRECQGTDAAYNRDVKKRVSADWEKLTLSKGKTLFEAIVRKVATALQIPLKVEDLILVGKSDRKGGSCALNPKVRSIFTAKPELTEMNSGTIRQYHSVEFAKFLARCDVVASAPGSVFLAGEKALRRVRNSPPVAATMWRVPRRVDVGLKGHGLPGLALGSSWYNEENPSHPGRPNLASWRADRNVHDRLPAALRVACLGIKFQTGFNASHEVHIWSDWAGESGLAWSGAFSVALAAALHRAAGTLATPEQWQPANLMLEAGFAKILRLAWLIETVIHGGCTSGAALGASLFPTVLPFFFRLPPSKEPMPKLWDADDTNGLSQFMQMAENDRKTLSRILDGVGFVPPVSPSHGSDVFKRLLQAGDILVIQTGVPKRTAENAAQEHGQKPPFRQHRDYDYLYLALKHLARSTEKCMERLLDNTLSWKETDFDWKELCELTTALQGQLSALGFGFAVADEVLGALRRDLAPDPIVGERAPFGGKLTGGGRGGSLVIVVGNECPRAKVDETLSTLRNNRQMNAVCVLYSARNDGCEPDGLKYAGTDHGAAARTT